MAIVARLPQDFVDQMIAHAREDAPIECCGLLAAKDGVITGLYRARNVEASPYRFSVDPLETRRIEEAMDASGTELAGFYHSHTGSPAIPSPTDIRQMGTFFGPPYVHFVIGLADPENPEVRVWYIEGGDRVEHEYEITS
ncbi:MAG: M67 family metallopeptidase [Dehalococcoidia bacterium]|nr:M67 family metallopeptidase [Dehalococcoidia bacterium]